MSKMVAAGISAFCKAGHDVCSTPSQCYCACHSSNSWTAKKLVREIDYHKNAIEMLEVSLDKLNKETK